jgi:Gpi18-like mannosyltransferase
MPIEPANRTGRKLMKMWQHLRVQGENRRWQAWSDVLVPWGVSRLLLLFAGWFSSYFAANPNYGDAASVTRGWQFSPIKLLDMWGRWDSGWYLDIAVNGYSLRGPLETTQSNVAFFPLYPLLIRAVLVLLPEPWRTEETALLIGVILSNVMFLAALFLLYRLTRLLMNDRAMAQRTLWYTVLFPAAFFFTSAYTEATFFLYTIALFYAALRRVWWAAGIFGALATLARPSGILLVAPLAWMYGEAIEWKFRQIRWNSLWIGLLPLAFAGFMISLQPITGDWIAPLRSQEAWSSTLLAPWITIFAPEVGVVPYITRIEQFLLVGASLLSVVALIKLPTKALGLYVLLLLVAMLTKGQLLATTRYLATAFPIFMALALLGKNTTFDRLVLTGSAAAQALLMAVWTRFYWVA